MQCLQNRSLEHTDMAEAFLLKFQLPIILREPSYPRKCHVRPMEWH